MPLLSHPQDSCGPIRSHSGWRTAAAAALSLLLVAGGASAAEAAGVRASGPAVAETALAETGDAAPEEVLPELVVSPPSPLLDELANNYEFTVLVRNPGPDELPTGSLTLEIDAQRVDSLAGLTEEFPETGVTLKTDDLGQIKAKEEKTVTLSVPRADFPLTASSAAGVYLVRAVFTPEYDEDDPAPTNGIPTVTVPAPNMPEGDAEEDAAADSEADVEADEGATDPQSTNSASISGVVPIVWKGVGTSTVKLSFIVPLVLPANIHTMPSLEQLGEITPKLDALLTAATQERATLAIDPRIIAGIRAYGDETPKEVQDFLKRLESTSLSAFLLQFADADPAAQAALGLSELLEPTSLDFVTRLGVFTEAEDPVAVEDTPGEESGEAQGDDTEADSSGSTAVPTLKQLLSLPDAEATAWPAGGAVDAATVSVLESSDISTLVIDSDNVTHKGGPLATLGKSSALVLDASLTAAARNALEADTETERIAATANAAAQLALAAQTGSTGLMLGLDRAGVADAEDPAQFLKELAAFTWVTPTTVAEQATGTATLKAGGTAEERQELLRSAVNREPSVDEVAPVLLHPEYLTGYQRTRLLDLFATRYAEPSANFEKVAQSYRKRDAQLLQGVQTINTQNTQLVGTSTRVPVQLRNTLPFDAVVVVNVAPASAALSVTEAHFPEVTVGAEGTSRILVPVRSRVSSGESGLVVNVTDASGDLTIHTTTLSISIRSVVETIALWTLGVLAALLLGFGIWRSVRRRRTLKRAAVPSGIART